MTACFFVFGIAVSGYVDVWYILLALELDAVTSVFCKHFDNPNKEHWFNKCFLLAFKVKSELHPKSVLVIRRYLF